MEDVGHVVLDGALREDEPLGDGADEYKNPVEFFRRTYLTESLKTMLVGAVKRLSGKGGDPVVQLQTNFGGGKTHSMLALYTEQVFSIGIVNQALQPILTSAKLRNLPDKGLFAFNPTCYLGVYKPDTFWFDGEG